jgi:Type II secretion system (T2SS), protein M subtype b
MRASRSLSATLRRLNPRERRVVLGGAVVSAAALVVMFAVLPFARRWSEREAEIAVRRERLVQLEALVASEAPARRALGEEERRRALLGQRLVSGMTPALASSNLQTLLQGYADESHVTLDRVDLVSETQGASSDSLPTVPVQLSATGDVYGLFDFLYRLQYGERLLVVDEVLVSAGYAPPVSASAGAPAGAAAQTLTWTVRLRAPYLRQDAARGLT